MNEIDFLNQPLEITPLMNCSFNVHHFKCFCIVQMFSCPNGCINYFLLFLESEQNFDKQWLPLQLRGMMNTNQPIN